MRRLAPPTATRVIGLNGRKLKMIMKKIQSTCTVGQIVTQLYFTALQTEPLHPDSALQCFLLLKPAVQVCLFGRRT